MRRDFNHERWLTIQDRLVMTRGGSEGGPHEGSGEPHGGSGEPHEGSGESDECCKSDKQWLYGSKTGQEVHQRLKEVNYDGYGWVP